MAAFPAQHTLKYIIPLLNDPIKIVRLEAARIISIIPKENMDKEQEKLLAPSIEEYRQSLLFVSERPETQLALAQLYQSEGQPDKAEAFKMLENGIETTNNAVLYYSLGLWYVRHKDLDKGLKNLQLAAEMEPDNARYQYVYAVAVGEKDVKKAIAILQSSLQKHSGHLDTLTALVSYCKQAGDQFNADKYSRKIDNLMTYKVK